MTGAVGLTALVLPPRLRALAAGTNGTPTLVVVFLRGGVDALNVVVPVGDPLYAATRPTIRIPRDATPALDDFYGLHPAFAPLMPLYHDGALAVIHACGSPFPTRSHFRSQRIMESAAPDDPSAADGWLNRYLAVAGGGAPVAGISLKTAPVRALQGAAPVLAFPRIAAFTLEGERVDERRTALVERYAPAAGTMAGDHMLDALDTIDVLATVPAPDPAHYPAGELGAALADAAALIKAEIGVKVIALDTRRWDHHFDEADGLAEMGGELAAGLGAFHADLGGAATRTLTLCMSEFGRRVRENGSGGTEHGHGGLMLALGGGIAGGRVLTRGNRWPGLAPDTLSRGEDLAVTTDFRDVFAEVLYAHLGLGLRACRAILPGFDADATRFPGLYA
jgi:uncharacterized protein (DUF1501 family)